MKRLFKKLEFFLVIGIMAILPFTKLLFLIFNTTINSIDLYYISCLIVLATMLFIPSKKLSYLWKYNTSEFLILCFSVVTILTMILLSVNFIFMESKIHTVDFKISKKGVKSIKSTSHYNYIRISRNEYSLDYDVGDNNLDMFKVGKKVFLNVKMGLLGFPIVRDINFEKL